jgi:predicted RND superfamily exporter protein
MKTDFACRLENFLFCNKTKLLFASALITLLLAIFMLRLESDPGFEKLLPTQHRYMQAYLEHQSEFGGANRILIAVRAKHGDIFDPGFFKVLKQVTDEVFFLPGVNRSSVRSILTPNVRFVEIVEGGFAGGNVVSADFRATPETLEQVRANCTAPRLASGW